MKPNLEPQTQNYPSTSNVSLERDQVVEVLYQRLNGRWYAFSVIGEEVFVGSLTDEELATVRRSAPDKPSA